MPEVVGDAGLLVAPADVAGLRAALVRLMADPELRNELGGRARQRIRELAWDRIIEQHIAVYQRVIAYRQPIQLEVVEQ
jgi:glycosyltransferase involved in cell wall biosynthesis